MAVEWSEELATGIERIDEQHRELYRQIASLHDAMRRGRLGDVPGLLDYLQRYALEHFATEEREMLATAYVGLGQHRRLHQRFIDDLERQRAHVDAGITPSTVVALSQWLGEWLREHVRTVDGDMGRHLRKRSARR